MNRNYILRSFAAILLGIMVLLAACGGQEPISAVTQQLSAKSIAAPEETPVSALVGEPQMIPHSIELRFECLLCHGRKGETELPYTDGHIGLSQDTCITCHQSAVMEEPEPELLPATTGGTTPAENPEEIAIPIPHTLKGHADCMMCHTDGDRSIPGGHTERINSVCATCH